MSFDLLPLYPRDRAEVIRLFTQYPYKTWQKRVQGIDPHRLAQLLWDLAEPQFGRPRTITGVAWRQEPREAVGFIMMAPHAWHSEVFSRSMGRILHLVNYVEPATVGRLLLDSLLADARRAGIEHLACRVDGQDWPNVHLLESYGFQCVDCSLKLARRLDDLPATNAESPDDIEIRPFEPPDLEALQQIAARSHTYNHFFNDPHLPRDRAKVLFQQWLARCAGGAASSILVAADADAQIVGFVTVLSSAALARVVGVSVGIIDYIVVDRSRERQGIGRRLLRAALRSLARDGHQWVELRASQDNYQALAFYCANRFQIVGSDIIFHRWEPPPQGDPKDRKATRRP